LAGRKLATDTKLLTTTSTILRIFNTVIMVVVFLSFVIGLLVTFYTEALRVEQVRSSFRRTIRRRVSETNDANSVNHIIFILASGNHMEHREALV
jgi:uncharacterized membrane protein